MRRFTIPLIVLALVISAAGVAPAALAQTCEAGCKLGSLEGIEQCVSINNPLKSCDATKAAATKVAAEKNANDPANDPSSQIPLPFGGGGIFASVMTFLMSIFAWLLGVAMVMLDYSVLYTVIKMGSYVKALPAIGVAWSILRDIGNITLIFGFLAIGISIILNTEKLGYGKKMLPMLLVAAVFLNFSLFISEAVIDTGNLFATQFYTQINGGIPAGNKSTSNETISGKIMSQLGLQTLYGAALSEERIKKEIFKEDNIGFISIMGILLFIVAAFVMFSLAFILIARFVALIFLIILAPIGFAGLAIPQLAPSAKKWWDTLFEQTITAPILLLLLYIALLVITNDNFIFDPIAGSKPDYLGFIQATNGTFNLPGLASILLSFLVAMGLLLAVTIFSKKLGAFGADWATKTAGKLTFGATGLVLRSTVGLGSYAASRAIRLSKNKYYGNKTKVGRVLAGTFDRGAKASFDVRGATTLGGLKAAGIEAGEAQKGGYRERQEKAIESHKKYIQSVTAAIDERGATKEEEAKIAAAEAAQKSAQTAYETAEEKYKTAKEQLDPQIAQQKAEIERLEKEKDRNDKFLPPNPEIEQKLKDARQNLLTSTMSFATENEKFKKATGDFETAKKAVIDANRVPSKRISDEKRDAQLGHAENIKGSLPGLVMFGPGGSLAAKKIIKDAKKDQVAMDRDRMRKLFETMDKELGEEKKEEKHEEEASQSKHL